MEPTTTPTPSPVAPTPKPAASAKSRRFLRPNSDFPTPLFLVSVGILAGLAIGALTVLHYLNPYLGATSVTSATTQTKAKTTQTAPPVPVRVTHSNSTLTATANPQKLVVKEWSVQVYLPSSDSMGGGTFSYAAGKSLPNAMGVADSSLVAKEPTCTAANGALGYLTRYAKGSFPKPGPGTEVYVATIGNYDYGYIHPQSTCSHNTDNSSLESQHISVVMGAVHSISPVQ